MKKAVLIFVGCFGLFLALAVHLASDYDQESLDALKVAPETHKLVFENRLVRVIEARVPPGGLELKHGHPHGLTIYLADFDSEVKTFPKGEVTKVHRKFGTVVWSEAVVHEVRNIGTTPSHALRIELKVN